MSIHVTSQLPMVPRPSSGSSTLNTYDSNLRVTALGGGHGLAATLSALKLIAGELTAIVTVADDGGSSGKIRDEMDVLPPGDLRMALAALCDDTDWGRTWRDTIQHRFTSKNGSAGTLDHHSLGNLLIVSLWELLGNPVDGLRWVGALLGARGTVLPMSTTPLTISGTVLSDTEDGQLRSQSIEGQVALATAAGHGRVSHVELSPSDAPATPEALDAIELSDWLVLGPGSLYTSVLPHLLLPEQREALENTTSKKALVMNLQPHTQETNGMSPADHLRTLASYAPGLSVDVVIADPSTIEDEDAFRAAAAELGASVHLGKVRDTQNPAVHDPLRLAVAFQEALSSF